MRGMEWRQELRMKKYLFMFVLTLLSGVVNAEVVAINGIYYDLLSDELEAEVTSHPSKYKGKVNIPQTVTYEGATYKVTSIGSDAFRDCFGLTAVTIPEGVEYIRSSSFCWCESLTSISIPNSVKIIAACAFGQCRSLISVSLGSSLIAIGDGAFEYCSQLTSINIPNNVTSIGKSCFQFCGALTSVTLGNNIKEIRFNTFGNCQKLETINIPNSVTRIESLAFSECDSLKDVVLPNSLTTIGSRAFSGSGLIEITIPSSVTDFGSMSTNDYSGPRGYVFCSCANLKKVIIGDGITDIPERTFDGCSNLNKVIFGKNVTSIGNKAFYSCGISSITIPDYVNSIGVNAFDYCENLKKLTIGSGVTYIGDEAFAYCSRLQDVYCYAKHVPHSGRNVFNGSFNEFPTLHVPGSSISEYSSTSQWNDFPIIVALNNDSQKCEIPEIRYENGELKFSCATNGAEFAYQITDDDIKSGYESSVKLDATYHISVYATRNGYENSDVATATLCWIEAEPKQEGIANKIAEIKSYPVLIQNIGGTISITGVEDNTPISVFSTSGMKVGSAVSGKGKNVIETSLRRGETAIVKIGEQSFKVLIK